MEEKNFFEKLREILKNNEIFYTMLGPIIAFLYELIKSYIFSFRYGISNKFIEINTKEILVNFLVIFIFSLFPLFVLYALNSIAYTKKEDKKKLRDIPCIFLLLETLIFLLILVNNAYVLTKVTAWIITIAFFVIVIPVNLYFIFVKRNLFAIFIKYLLITAILGDSIPQNFEVLTYKDKNKNIKKVIAMGYRDGEYRGLDYDENKGEIYKIPVYSISASEIEEIELRKINDLKLISSRKLKSSLKESYDNEYIKWEIAPNLFLKLVYEETESSVNDGSENNK